MANKTRTECKLCGVPLYEGADFMGFCSKRHNEIYKQCLKGRFDSFEDHDHLCNICRRPLTGSRKFHLFCDECVKSSLCRGKFFASCEVCGERFEKDHKTLTCSPECKSVYYRRLVDSFHKSFGLTPGHEAVVSFLNAKEERKKTIRFIKEKRDEKRQIRLLKEQERRAYISGGQAKADLVAASCFLLPQDYIHQEYSSRCDAEKDKIRQAYKREYRLALLGVVRNEESFREKENGVARMLALQARSEDEIAYGCSDEDNGEFE